MARSLAGRPVTDTAALGRQDDLRSVGPCTLGVCLGLRDRGPKTPATSAPSQEHRQATARHVAPALPAVTATAPRPSARRDPKRHVLEGLAGLGPSSEVSAAPPGFKDVAPLETDVAARYRPGRAAQTATVARPDAQDASVFAGLGEVGRP